MQAPQVLVGVRAHRGVGNPRRALSGYGVVVDSVNVSVLLYVPVLSPSVALIDCLNPIATGSPAIAAGYVSSSSGLALPVTGAKADAGWAALVASTWTGLSSARVPLTRWPVDWLLGSATVSVASPAVLVTSAVSEAV
jgi:hypothetical protein